jgi:hypothetical protein
MTRPAARPDPAPDPKVTGRHLAQAAYLYVRQSTLHQVVANTESGVRQYALRQRAVALGWPAEWVVVIDCDQGQSGARALRPAPVRDRGLGLVLAATPAGGAGRPDQPYWPTLAPPRGGYFKGSKLGTGGRFCWGWRTRFGSGLKGGTGGLPRSPAAAAKRPNMAAVLATP